MLEIKVVLKYFLSVTKVTGSWVGITSVARPFNLRGMCRFSGVYENISIFGGSWYINNFVQSFMACQHLLVIIDNRWIINIPAVCVIAESPKILCSHTDIKTDCLIEEFFSKV